MYVHPNPQLFGRVLGPAELRALLVNAVFAVGDVARLRQIYPAAFALPHARELAHAPVYERLTVERLEESAPRWHFCEKAFVTFVATVEREARRARAGRARGERAPHLLVASGLYEAFAQDVREGVRANVEELQLADAFRRRR